MVAFKDLLFLDIGYLSSLGFLFVIETGPSPGYSSRGSQKPEGGAKNQKGGPHFKNTVLNVCNNQGVKREMGGTDFKWGGRAPLAPSLATALDRNSSTCWKNRARTNLLKQEEN